MASANKYKKENKWTHKNQNEWFDTWVKQLPSLAGKTAAVTGCTSGIGLVIASELAGLKATVFLLNRPSERATACLAKVKEAAGPENASNVHHVDCDLMDFASVKAAGAAMRAQAEPLGGLDILVNNAGIMLMPDAPTKDGFDTQMQTNHLGHFLLTKEVLSALSLATKSRNEARVVHVSSEAYMFAACKMLSPWPIFKKSVRAKYLEPKGGKLGGSWKYPVLPLGPPMWRYAQSKLAQAVFSECLHDRFAKNNIKSMVINPGVSFETDLVKTSCEKGGGMGGLAKKMFNIGGMGVKGSAQGAIAAVTLPDAAGGKLWRPTKRHKFFFAGGFGSFWTWGASKEAEVKGFMKTAKNKKVLWEKSLEACGISEAEFAVKGE